MADYSKRVLLRPEDFPKNVPPICPTPKRGIPVASKSPPTKAIVAKRETPTTLPESFQQHREAWLKAVRAFKEAEELEQALHAKSKVEGEEFRDLSIKLRKHEEASQDLSGKLIFDELKSKQRDLLSHSYVFN